MASAFGFAGGVELKRAVGLEMEGFGVVAGEEDELVVEAVCISCVVEGEVGEEMRMDLRLVCAWAWRFSCC